MKVRRQSSGPATLSRFIMLLLFISGSLSYVQAQGNTPQITLEARLIAVGLPAVGGVRQVGAFHSGGAIPSNPEFAAATEPGKILDPDRLLVASGSNFGAPLGVASQAAGAILSINPAAAQPLLIPPDFAAQNGQAAILNGDVQFFTGQTPDFLNRHHNPAAVTAMQPAVANPRYISINNAFGRPWFANVPEGIGGLGTSTVIDPTGHPLAGPPSPTAGGVFAGAQTNREVPIIEGALYPAAAGTAFMGISPDDSGFAVFAVVQMDGSVVQVHVADGVDGLASAETVSSLDIDPKTTNGIENGGVIGIAFNWIPSSILFIADGSQNRLAKLTLTDDGQVFKVASTAYLNPPELNNPVDLSPTLPEIANPRFSSHTTLAGGSDLYVANRGDGSLVRLTQDGLVIAQARINLPGIGVLSANQLQGMAVSADGQRLFLTLSAAHPDFPGYEGMLIEVSAFDQHGPLSNQNRYDTAQTDLDPALIAAGEVAFSQEFTAADGLGPLFNQTSCVACHSHPTTGGMGANEETMVARVGFWDENSDTFDPLISQGGPVVRSHVIQPAAEHFDLTVGIPDQANVVSLRTAPALYGLDLIDQIPDEVILAQAVDKGDGIYGRAHIITQADGSTTVGRFGWKADVATLDEMIGVAMANELGITNPHAAVTQRRPNSQSGEDPIEVEDDGTLITALKAFIASLSFPNPDS
ncbi:MAG: di-heme oxidoredictase family protein [Ardenticatenaceae bacterium]|nr:di-heme oxidoredictase family protein [Ardenticatenaceae bacterium]